MFKKKTARSQVKYPGLKKQYNSKLKQEYLDFDYIDKLNDYEKQWLSDWSDEHYGAKLDYKNLENNRFHKTPEDKKACTDRNNARNRCQYGIARAGGKINNPENGVESVDTNSEDDVINAIDKKNSNGEDTL